MSMINEYYPQLDNGGVNFGIDRDGDIRIDIYVGNNLNATRFIDFDQLKGWIETVSNLNGVRTDDK